MRDACLGVDFSGAGARAWTRPALGRVQHVRVAEPAHHRLGPKRAKGKGQRAWASRVAVVIVVGYVCGVRLRIPDKYEPVFGPQLALPPNRLFRRLRARLPRGAGGAELHHARLPAAMCGAAQPAANKTTPRQTRKQDAVPDSRLLSLPFVCAWVPFLTLRRPPPLCIDCEWYVSHS